MPSRDETSPRSVVRLPLWPFVILVVLLVGMLVVWFGWRDTILERRAVARLQRLPGVDLRRLGSRTDATPLKRLLAFSRVEPLGPIHSPIFTLSLEQPLPVAAIPDLGAIRHLHTITAKGHWFTDRHLAALRTGDSLASLTLLDTSVTDTALGQLAGLTRLERIQLTGTPIDGSALATFASLPKLHVLSLGRTRITDASLAHLAGMRSLVELDLYLTPITDAAGPALARIPNLRKLSLDRTAIGDATLLAISGRASRVWTTLSLRYTRVTSAGLSAAGLQASNFLLAGTDLDDSVAPWLAGCHLVERLDLAHTRITDAGLVQLREMGDLWDIHLQHTAVTDHGVIGLLRGDPAVTGPLDTSDGLAAAIQSIRDRKQKPLLWVEPDELEGTGVSSALKAHLAAGRSPASANNRAR